MTYPSTSSGGTPSYSYQYDSLARLNGMLDSSSNPVVSGVQYGPANELLNMTYSGIAETRTYNYRLQVLSIVANNGVDLVNSSYAYSATQNNGKILSTANQSATDSQLHVRRLEPAVDDYGRRIFAEFHVRWIWEPDGPESDRRNRAADALVD